MVVGSIPPRLAQQHVLTCISCISFLTVASSFYPFVPLTSGCISSTCAFIKPPRSSTSFRIRSPQAPLQPVSIHTTLPAMFPPGLSCGRTSPAYLTPCSIVITRHLLIPKDFPTSQTIPSRLCFFSASLIHTLFVFCFLFLTTCPD